MDDEIREADSLDEARANKKKMTRAEAGRKGGRSTRDRYGSQFFREIGRVGGSRGTSPRRTQNGQADAAGQ